jgi:Fic family protein
LRRLFDLFPALSAEINTEAVNASHNLRMNYGYKTYIWEHYEWPAFRYDFARLVDALSSVMHSQGFLLGRLADVGLRLRNQASLIALTEDVLKTSAIEGETLNADSVRSSLARRLGVEIGALAPVDRHVEGVVEMILDATSNCHSVLNEQRLWAWHAALFPTGYSGLSKITVGNWRDDRDGPMQVVSGPMGRQRVHYQAPPASVLPAELTRFVQWVNSHTSHPPVLKAGLAHLWFVTLHPLEDGNGRIARAVGDMLLARADGGRQRFYSLSAQIQRDRENYYDVLERTQKGSLDVTDWLLWFLQSLQGALAHSETTVDAVLAKARFWQKWAETPLNARQSKMINKLLDGFDGNVTAKRWSNITSCSPDTALRDITELMGLGILAKHAGGGRSTAYQLIV